MKRLRYTAQAQAELAAILDHIRVVSPTGSRNVAKRLREVIKMLMVYPEVGVLTEHPLLRCRNASPYPYLVFYELRKDIVLIHRIRHAARDRQDLMESDFDQ